MTLAGMDLEQRIQNIEQQLRGLHFFSDKVAFAKNVEMQSGRYVSTIRGGLTSSGVAGSPFPIGWTCAKNSTGNYTITHNMNRTDYAVVATFKDSAASNVVGAAISAVTAANSFTLDIQFSGGHIDHAVYFAVIF